MKRKMHKFTAVPRYVLIYSYSVIRRFRDAVWRQRAFVVFAIQCVCAAPWWKYSAWSEDITTDPHGLPDSLFSRSDLNQFTNSIMLSPNTGWEMMNDYVKHIISLLHHHCNMTAKFHSSYPISSLFKERKLLVPVIRYVARLCARVKPSPIRLSALLLP